MLSISRIILQPRDNSSEYEAVSLTVYAMGLGLHICEEVYKEATYCEKSQVC